MRWTTAGAAAALVLSVAACGTNQSDRIAGGAATGAAVGLVGGPVGAVVGGVAGGVVGGVTDPQDVNLGRPPWSNPEVRTPVDNAGRGGRGYASRSGGGYAGSSDVRQAQAALNARGFNAGPADGVMGSQTSGAVADFQRSNNIAATGRLDAATRQALGTGGGGAVATGSSATTGGAGMSGGGAGGSMGSSGSMGTSGGTMPSGSTGTGAGGMNSGANTGSTGPGGTSNVGSGNQPGTGGTSTR